MQVLTLPPPILHNRDGKPGAFCSKLLLKLLSRPDATSKHLEYLLCTLLPRLKVCFDASKIPLSKVMALFPNTKVLSTLVRCGVSIDGRAIEMAVDKLDDSSTKNLSLILSRWNKMGSLSAPLEAAIKLHKINFVACLLEHGAGAPAHGVDSILLEALEQKKFGAAESILNVAGKISSTTVDLGALFSSGIINNPTLIEKLIRAGVNPDGLGKNKTLTQVLQLNYLPTAKQVETICLLLQNGADCKYLCDASPIKTTPLHVATDLAIRAGYSVQC